MEQAEEGGGVDGDGPTTPPAGRGGGGQMRRIKAQNESNAISKVSAAAEVRRTPPRACGHAPVKSALSEGLKRFRVELNRSAALRGSRLAL